MEQHRRSRVPYDVDRGVNALPSIVSYTTATRSSSGTMTINVPANANNGNMLLMTSNHRNGSTTWPASWLWLETFDVSSGEWVYLYYRICNNEPASYSFTTVGYTAAIMLCVANVVAVTSPRAFIDLEKAPRVYAHVNDLHLAWATSAASGTNMTGFTGMTTICTSYEGSNAREMAAYKVVTERGWTTEYPMDPTGISYDGYMSVILKSRTSIANDMIYA